MEDNTAYIEFLKLWQQIMMISTVVTIIIAVIVYIGHKFKIIKIKEYKKKHDYINLYEIKTYKWAFIILAIAAAMYSNGYNDVATAKSTVWFFVRFFVAGCVGTVIGYVSVLILKYYYPAKMQKKLEKWRRLPRINPKTGNEMKLMTEDEENVYLDEGMQAEETVFSVDYDVWVDEVTGDTQIEKYKGSTQVLECNSCGFRTLKIIQEEIIKDTYSDGELLKQYECTYCRSERTTQHKIIKLTYAHEEIIRKQKEEPQSSEE